MSLRRRQSAPWLIYTPVITWTAILAFLALGAGMTLQPDRFSRTPSYHNLLILTSAPIWGGMYLGSAALLVAWRLDGSRLLGVLAHTVSFMLTTFWLTAFLVRYWTDDATTIVNVVSWSILVSLVVRSGVGLDADR